MHINPMGEGLGPELLAGGPCGLRIGAVGQWYSMRLET